MFCPSCGTSTEPEAQFCKSCGAAQSFDATPLTTSEEVTPTAPAHLEETPPGVYSQTAGPSSGFSTGAVSYQPTVSLPNSVNIHRHPLRVTNFLLAFINLLTVFLAPWFIFPGSFKLWGWHAVTLLHAHFGFPNGGYIFAASAVLLFLSALVAMANKSKIGPALQTVFALGFLECVAGWFWVGRHDLAPFAAMWAMAAFGVLALIISLVQLFSRDIK